MKIAFFGAGKMASAIIQGVLRSEFCRADEIFVSDPLPTGPAELASSLGVQVADSNAEGAKAAEAVLLCVKPGDARPALESARDALHGKLLISIAAGVRASSLTEAAPGCRVIRVMPNTAAVVGKSVSAIAPGPGATASDVEIASAMFGAVGTVLQVEEKQMDAITALSGSGPAFVYLMVEAMADGGVASGLPRNLALELALRTLEGAAEMLAVSKEHPATLREMVTSPGGTTIAGLLALEQAGVRFAFADAVRKAALRSSELSAS